MPARRAPRACSLQDFQSVGIAFARRADQPLNVLSLQMGTEKLLTSLLRKRALHARQYPPDGLTCPLFLIRHRRAPA
jgi:hypothetical protein